MRSECARGFSEKETDGEEETQRAACKLVWLDPHPVVIMDTCACIFVGVCLKEKETERVKRLHFILKRIEPDISVNRSKKKTNSL